MSHVQPRGEEKGLTRKGGLRGRTIGLRRREGREAGSQRRLGPGELSRIPGPGREHGLSGSGAAGEASRARGEAEERGANKPPRLIELYVVQKG